MKKQKTNITALDNKETSYVQRKTAEWLLRLLKQDIPMTAYFFNCLKWVVGDLRVVLRNAFDFFKKLPKTPEIGEALEALAIATNWSSHKLESYFDDIVRDFPCTKNIIKIYIMQSCRVAAGVAAHDRFYYARVRKLLKKTFDISQESLALCEFVYFNQTNSVLENYFEDHLEIWRQGNRNLLTTALSMNPTCLKDSITELVSCGILDIDRYFRIESAVVPFWETTNLSDMSKFFCAPLAGETLSLDKFRIPEEDVRYVSALLTQKETGPVHIILYGAPGTGKTTFVRSLAKSLGVKAWAVSSREGDNDGDRRASLVACLNIARRYKGSFVLVDEAERLLDTSWRGGSNTKDKAWLNSFMEAPDKRIIWITNRIEHIDPAVRRRFSFSVCFEALGKTERQGIWKEIVARYGVKNCFTEPKLKTLADNYQVSAAIIEKAVSQAKELGYAKSELSDAVELALCAYSTLSRDGEATDRKDKSKEEKRDFNPDGISLDSSLQDLIDKCRRVDSAMRSETPLPQGCATILFYGPPGTGKTALARHIAKELDRECFVRRASDLLSPYVGVAEQQIAEAFRRVEKDGSVLLIDEVDTFLYSREIAQRSWETSLVNEFLTALEECRGFCICTTNRLENLDAAAIRRFSHKVAFGYAKPEQAQALYSELLAPLCSQKLPDFLENELRSFSMLTPGDFHAVRSQYNLFFADSPTVNHDTLIAALRREESLKAKLQTSRIGF
ncbi:hypothetical protein AGMMS50276_04140 [Synergistales bacterium]|nr:hypothetical protein AGMMS50276_04140 [Synergistales bacterium]